MCAWMLLPSGIYLQSVYVCTYVHARMRAGMTVCVYVCMTVCRVVTFDSCMYGVYVCYILPSMLYPESKDTHMNVWMCGYADV
jgi:hypothetical protein